MAVRAAGPILNGNAANVSTASWTIPAGVATGDVAMFAVGSNTATGTFSTPTGWTVLGGPTVSSSAYTTIVYGRVLAAADAGTAVSVTLSIAGRAHGAYIILSGAAASLPTVIGQVSTTTAAATIAAPNVTPTAASSTIVNFGMVRSSTTSGAITTTVDAGGTKQAESDTAFAAGTIPNFACNVATRNTLGSSGVAGGGATFTSTDTGSTGQGWTIAVAPAATVGYVGSATPAAVSSTATTTSVTVPAAAATGHLAVMVLNGSDIITNTAPTGWTKQTSQSKTGICLDVWTKTLAAGDLGTTVTVTSNNTVNYKRNLQMFLFSNGQPGAIKSTLETVAGIAHKTPAATVTDPAAWALVGVADRASPGSQSWDLTAAPALTSQQQFIGSGGGAVSGVLATASSVGSGTLPQYTISGTVSTATAAMFAVVVEPTTTTTANTAAAGADVQSEPRMPVSRTATATGTPTSWAWTASPALTLSGASTATVSFTTPPNIAEVIYTLTVTASYASGPAAVDSFMLTVYPVTRRFFAVGGGEVPLRVQRFT